MGISPELDTNGDRLPNKPRLVCGTCNLCVRLTTGVGECHYYPPRFTVEYPRVELNGGWCAHHWDTEEPQPYLDTNK